MLPHPVKKKNATVRTGYTQHFRFSRGFQHLVDVIKTNPDGFPGRFVTAEDVAAFNTGGQNESNDIRIMRLGLLIGLAIDKVPSAMEGVVIPEIFKKPGYPFLD